MDSAVVNLAPPLPEGFILDQDPLVAVDEGVTSTLNDLNGPAPEQINGEFSGTLGADGDENSPFLAGHQQNKDSIRNITEITSDSIKPYVRNSLESNISEPVKSETQNVVIEPPPGFILDSQGSPQNQPSAIDAHAFSVDAPKEKKDFLDMYARARARDKIKHWQIKPQMLPISSHRLCLPLLWMRQSMLLCRFLKAILRLNDMTPFHYQKDLRLRTRAHNFQMGMYWKILLRRRKDLPISQKAT